MENFNIFFKALSDQTRLKIIDLLSKEKEMCVCNIYKTLEVSQPRISKHLAILREIGLVKDRPNGKWVYYSLNDNAIKKLDEFLSDLTSKKRKKAAKC
ncbi:MAG: metalloregulator ArsR/SmtB family transcription factor [Actinobacteria bacterium]|nr:metalloregulator ArsR/SmtB family transcription factor [Actinomycetota bacterium]